MGARRSGRRQRPLVLDQLTIDRRRPDRLLLVRPGAIGDSLLLAPTLAAVRAIWAGTRVEVVAHPAVGELFLAADLVDAFHSRDGPTGDALFAPSPALARARVGPIAAALVWATDPTGRALANLEAIGARVSLQPSQPPIGSGRHVADHLLAGLRPIGAEPFELEAAVAQAVARIRRLSLAEYPTDRSILLHPGSGGRRKNWPLGAFRELAVVLERSTGVEPTWLLGPAELEQADLRRLAGHALVEPSLRALSAELAGCGLYVGNDSGISHLAGLSGAPTLTLFGPTEPATWRPLGPRVEILRAEPLASLTVTEVAERALALLRRAERRPSGS